MKAKQLSRRQKVLIAGGIVLLILAILAGAFFWYVSDYYRAEDVALEVMTQDNSISVQDNLTILSLLTLLTPPSFSIRAQGRGRGLSASAGPDSADRSHLYFGTYAFPHGNF